MRLLIAGILFSVSAIIAAILAWGAPRTVAAEAEEESDLLGERAKGIALNCAACHGTGGRLETDIPPIAGRPEALLRAQLLALKGDQVPNATVMPRIAKGYTDEELEALARYFAALDPETNSEED